MRHVRVLLAAALVIAGCSGADAPSDDAAPAASTPASDTSDGGDDSGGTSDGEPDLEDVGEIEVDRGLLSVEITLPADFIGDDDPVAYTDGIASEIGIDWSDRTVNPDGSVTVKLSRAEHGRLMDELRAGFDEALLAMPDSYESVQSATANRDYDRFEVVVDRAAFESSFDGFVSLEILLYAGFYGIFNGDDPESARLEIEFIDAATGEVFDTRVAPDDFQD